MIRLEVLVEEPSAEAALRYLLPRLVVGRARARVVDFGSKYALLKVLEARLRAYRRRVDGGEDIRLVVLVDRDADDCERLKARLERSAATAGLPTKTRPDGHGVFLVVNRIVVEELESWFIGDSAALRAAFSSLPPIDPSKGIFRNPDNGGSWEQLHRLLRRHGVYRGSYPKIEAARRIARHMEPAANRSVSFRHFVAGIEALLA